MIICGVLSVLYESQRIGEIETEIDRSLGGLLVFLCFTCIDFTGEEKTKEQ